MSYSYEDEQWDALWDFIEADVYPDHKERAIEEFTTERLQSFYIQNPNILVPGKRMFVEARYLEEDHPEACFVFATSAIEIYLKAAVLKPIIYGLVHNEQMAEVIVKTALDYSGFDRYKKLISRLFLELCGKEIKEVKRPGSNKSILEEASEIRKTRNNIVHRGDTVTRDQAKFALDVTYMVLWNIVDEMVKSLDLWIDKKGTVRPKDTH